MNMVLLKGGPEQIRPIFRPSADKQRWCDQYDQHGSTECYRTAREAANSDRLTKGAAVDQKMEPAAGKSDGNSCQQHHSVEIKFSHESSFRYICLQHADRLPEKLFAELNGSAFRSGQLSGMTLGEPIDELRLTKKDASNSAYIIHCYNVFINAFTFDHRRPRS